MDKRPRKQAKNTSTNSEEVSSAEWEFINMTEQEEDIINRMYRLVGDRAMEMLLYDSRSSGCCWFNPSRWDLIAGRIPGRKAEEIERFWIMRHGEVFAGKRNEHCDKNSIRFGEAVDVKHV